MYNNIGEKIKALAIIGAALEAIAFLIAGIIFCANDSAGIGLVLIFGGALFSWLSSFILYGFGQLIVDADTVAGHYYNQENQCEIRQQTNEIRHDTAQALRAIKDSGIDQSYLIDFRCPLCNEKISYTKGEIITNKQLYCPMCNETFKTADAFKR